MEAASAAPGPVRTSGSTATVNGTAATADSTVTGDAAGTGSAVATAPAAGSAASDGGRPARRLTRRDLLVFGAFLLGAIWVTSPIWMDPQGRVASLYKSDPAQVQFFLAHSVRVVLHGEFPFYTDFLNYPDGVNLMANTSILALGIPMVPVTLLFGPAVSFVVLVTLGLAGTASAWYYMLSRHIVSTPAAAIVGGWLCGFSPAMLSHASWHPNIISQFLLPFIVWRVLVLTRSRRPIRDGLILAALVVYQMFINEEILLFTAMACGIFLLAVLAQRPGAWSAAWRPLGIGVATCAVVAGALLAYPLYIQFAGPMAYHGLSDAVRDYGNDLMGFFNPGSPTIGGSRRSNVELAPNYSEENAFFGWGLLLVAVGAVLWMRRDLIVRALAFTGVFYAVLSLGEVVSYWGRDLFPGPWELLVRLPLLNAVVPTRFGMITSVVIAIVVALAVDRAARLRQPDRSTVRAVTAFALVVALLPIAPMPLRMVSRPEVPDFITSGAWQEYVAADQALVPIPVPSMGHTDGMRWAASTNLGFRIPGGYFLAPRNANSGDPGRFGGRRSGFGAMLDEVAATGRSVTYDDRERRRGLDELRHWNAAILVLPVDQGNAEPLRLAVEQFVGPAQRVQDVWIWDVRALTSRQG